VAFLDTIGHIADISAIPVAVVGFGATIWQTRRARTAAEAARRAAQASRVAMGRASLLVLLPQLHRVEEELERAVRSDGVDLVFVWLGTWRWQAAQTRGLLNIASPREKKVLKLLQTSIMAASTTKAEILTDPQSDLLISTKAVRESISLVTNELGTLAIEQGLNAGGVINDSE
jgi:hypothetical protein